MLFLFTSHTGHITGTLLPHKRDSRENFTALSILRPHFTALLILIVSKIKERMVYARLIILLLCLLSEPLSLTSWFFFFIPNMAPHEDYFVVFEFAFRFVHTFNISMKSQWMKTHRFVLGTGEPIKPGFYFSFTKETALSVSLQQL